MKKLFILLCFTGHLLHAHPDSAATSSPRNTSLKAADAAFTARHYRTAANLYAAAFKANPANTGIAFKYALSHHYLYHLPELGTRLFRTATTNTDPNYNFYKTNSTRASTDALYFLGKSYLEQNHTDTAILYFAQYQTKVKDAALDAGRQVMMCVNNNNLVNQPRQLKITSLGAPVNSGYDDTHPVLSIDGKVMYISSRKPAAGSQSTDEVRDNDIYISYKMDNAWAEPSPFDFNTNRDEEPLFVNVDGNTFYFAQEDKKGTRDIFISQRLDGKWSKPEKMKGVNTSFNENGITFSADGTTMVISSNRPGGYGGYDLYISQNKNGKWGPLKNMGEKINTDLDELSPHMHPTENRLYFAGNGNTQWGMGGFDILFAQRDSANTWSEPFTLGYPVNSGSNEINYYVSANGSNYYATLNANGDFDIYEITAGEFEKRIEEKIVTITGTETVTEVQLLEVEKEKLVEVDKEVEVTKIEEVEKEVEKNVGVVTAEEAKKLDKVIAVEEKEVAVETIVETEKIVYTNKTDAEIDSINKVNLAAPTTTPVIADNSPSTTSNTPQTTNNTPPATHNSQPATNNTQPTTNNTQPTTTNPPAYKTVPPVAGENKSLIRPKIHFAPTGTDLEEIAKLYDVSVADLKKWNKIADNKTTRETPLVVGYEYNDEVKDLLAMEQLKIAGIDASDREAIIANIKKYYEDKMNSSSSTVFKNLYFEFNSQTLDFSSTELNILVTFLKEHKDIKIECIGHTDNVGAWETNFWVSRERARKVYQYLIDNGVSTSRIIFNGKGSTEPIASNYTLDGRAKNRRVEVKLIK